MTRSAKVACSIIAIIGAGFLATAIFAVYAVLNHGDGMKLGGEGFAALALGNNDRAITCFNDASRKYLAKSWRAWVYLCRGTAYSRKSRFDEAIRDFTESIRLNPTPADPYAGRGWAYQQKDDIEKALGDFNEAIARDPNSQTIYYWRGSIFYQKKEMDRAIADFDEAVRCDPDSPHGFLMRGRCYAAKNDLDHALSNFDATLMMNPKSADALRERARIYERKGDYARSRHDFAEARRLQPWAHDARKFRLPPPWEGFFENPNWNVISLRNWDSKAPPAYLKPYRELIVEAGAAHHRGDFDQAIDLNNVALTENIRADQAAVAMMNRGNAYSAKGDADQALQDYEEAITLDPRNAGAYVDRARILWKKGDRDDAIKDLNEAIRLNPKQWQAYFNRAADLRDEGRLDDAMTDLNKVIKLNPRFAPTYVNRGGINMRKDDLDKAIQEYNKAIALDAKSVDGYRGRAAVHLRKKQFADAEGDFEKIAQLDSKRPDLALNSEAWLLATCSDGRARNGDKAIAEATKACQLTKWANWRQIDTLAAAYAEAGQFGDAVKYQQDALRKAGADKEVSAATARLQLYQEKKPYRDEPKN
ncbi:MAG: hypothetical protein QOG67_805 [Verrucomicrobiota bacterium]|jgi:tetratricopeptide (TPR) repeat protein